MSKKRKGKEWIGKQMGKIHKSNWNEWADKFINQNVLAARCKSSGVSP